MRLWLATVLLVGGLLMVVDFLMNERSDSNAMQVRMGTTEGMHHWLTRGKEKKE